MFQLCRETVERAMMKECWSSKESPWFLWTWPGVLGTSQLGLVRVSAVI